MVHAPFVPLRNFSSYTLLEGANDPAALAEVVLRRGFPAAALCDRNGLFAAMPFADACRSKGIQPIIGTVLSISRPGAVGDAPVIDWLVLLAQDDAGYANLCRLVSFAHLSPGEGQPPHVDFDTLSRHGAGLLCLTAGADGALARMLADNQATAAACYCDALQKIFADRLYIELSRRGDAVETAAEDGLLALAYDRGIAIVATNPNLYADADFHPAHDALLCIAQSTYVESRDRRRSNSEDWLKPAEAMEDLFSDLPEALVNTCVIARRCAVDAPKRGAILPSIAGDREAEARQLRKDAFDGLCQRLRKISPDADEAALRANHALYFERLSFETDVIISMGFQGYFLIVADFIKWAKSRAIAVGPGRGSGAGSLVAWALTITDLDPIRLGLLFERFLNPERVNMPDFDIDFCETRRGEVIRYVQSRYGADTVAQIITFGTMKARAVLKDTGRVLQMGYNQVDRLAKLVPNHPTDPWNLERALNGVSELNLEYKQQDGVRRLFDLARRLEGLPRNISTHAAGVVIGDRPLSELVPLYRDPRSEMPVTQFDMKYVEKAGLVKFDFLGLKTLSVLNEALRLLAGRGIRVDLELLPWDDASVYELLQRGDTVGVFQLESEGMRRTLSAVRPTDFGDIIALVSLYRPGPMDNIGTFGARKNGREPISYPHPLLEPILAETYGIFVYQEQVMQAAQVLAGFSLGQADVLRRAMGKKNQKEMDQLRSSFVTGCAASGISEVQAHELFALIDKFAGYGFNKSHAAAYALLAYQTAWLKVHYPHEFFAASMSFDNDNTDKLAIFVDDARRLNIAMAPPCINASEAAFSVERREDGELQIRYGLSALKGVGEKAMEAVVAERMARGSFTGLDAFAERIDPRLLNRRQVEALAASGAFDCLIGDRAVAFASAESLLASANAAAHARTSGQGGLFGGDTLTMPTVQLRHAEPWSPSERMANEKEAFGYYFSAHPVSRYRALAAGLRVRSYGELARSTPAPPGERRTATMIALVESAKSRTSQRGNRYLQCTLSDQSGQFPASCFDEGAMAQLAHLSETGGCALIGAEIDWREGEEAPRVAVRSAQSIDEMMAGRPLRLEISLISPLAVPDLANVISTAGRGSGEVIVIADDPVLEDGPVRLCVATAVALDEDMVQRIERIQGVSNAVLMIRPALHRPA